MGCRGCSSVDCDKREARLALMWLTSSGGQCWESLGDPHLLVPGVSLAELLAGGLAGDGAFLASCWAGLCLGRIF